MRHVTFFRAVSRELFTSSRCRCWASHSSHCIWSSRESKRQDCSRSSWFLAISFRNWGRTVQSALRGLSWSSERKMEFCTSLMQRYQSQLWKLYMFYKGEKIIQILSLGFGPFRRCLPALYFNENGCAFISSSGILTCWRWYFGRDPEIIF